MSARGTWAWRRTLGWAVLFVAAGLLGRATRLEGTALAFVWPAAGVGVLWFLLSASSRRYRVEMPLLAGLALAVNLVTGASVGLALTVAAANLVHAVVGGMALLRWSPRDPAQRRSTSGLVAVGGSALAGAVASAPVTVLVLVLVATEPSQAALTALVWVMRYAASSAVVVAFALAWRARWVDRRAAGVEPPAAGIAEFGGLLALSFVVHAAVFSLHPGDAFAFLTLPVTVLVGGRLGPAWAATHGLLVSVFSVTATLAGLGPFGAIESVTLRTAVVQAFVATTGLVGLMLSLEVQQRRVALQALQSRGDALEGTLQTAVVGNALVSLAVPGRGEIEYANPALRRWWGCGDQQPLLGRSWLDLLDRDGQDTFQRVLDQLATGERETWNGELQHQISSGEQRWCQLAAAQLPLPSAGGVEQPVANVQLVDITERKQLEAQLAHEALHDPLTKLANRALLLNRLEHGLVLQP